MEDQIYTRRALSRVLCSYGLLGAVPTSAHAELAAQVTVSRERVLTYGKLRAPCVIGRNGISSEKTEGDFTTPAGSYSLRQLFYRSDRIKTIETMLPKQALTPLDAWCDDPAANEYNMLVRRPFTKHTETLWRQDHLYDVLIVIGYNDAPVTPGRGSAIFLHVAPPGLTATDGCIAIALEALLTLAHACSTDTVIRIGAV